jgi:oxygen-independent coproporphyrinogen-3 oxidase
MIRETPSLETTSTRLLRPFGDDPYVGYSYAYPHKTAYRLFDRAIDLSQLWQDESGPAALYVHVPFCEFRCGFCNLFTLTQPAESIVERWFRQLQHESQIVAGALNERTIARFAVGGGTPTQLSVRQLEQLFEIMKKDWRVDPHQVPTSVEASPHTLDDAKLSLLEGVGVERISLGVQSFDEDETHSMGRPQRRHEVERALDLIRKYRFAVLNIDLIYGAAGQSPAQFVKQIETALRWQPQEFYLYPLYVRPLTGLGRNGAMQDDHRLACYREGRDHLAACGYEQVSMRMFRRTDQPTSHTSTPVYCCQSDGMIGLGCGARSYTRRVHYSGEYAVGKSAIGAIVTRYLDQSPDEFREARYGFVLNEAEQQRRFGIVSLLQRTGLDLDAFRTRFSLEPFDAIPQLATLVERQWAEIVDHRLVLSDEGLAWSDAIGPWLYSADVRERMAAYDLH